MGDDVITSDQGWHCSKREHGSTMSDQEIYCCCAGCGFLDTVTKLIKLGSNVNARDLTQCTPLQNAAHGTYSALATMPLNGSQGGASCLPFLLALPANLSACVEPSLAHVQQQQGSFRQPAQLTASHPHGQIVSVLTPYSCTHHGS